jgi:hypothetical protein
MKNAIVDAALLIVTPKTRNIIKDEAYCISNN